MKRIRLSARRDWRAKVEELGFVFHTVDGEPYWDETACYQFSAREIGTIEAATNELHDMCLTAVEYAIANDRLAQMGIPEELAALIAHSWDQDHPTVYGRFDLAYDGDNPPKMLEYNADTPTSLLEAAVVQWHWLEEVFPRADQFNSIHEKLIDAWAWMRGNRLGGETLYLTSLENVEDEITAAYMMDVASQAGIPVRRILLKDIGWKQSEGRFVDLSNRPINHVFKLYPSEYR